MIELKLKFLLRVARLLWSSWLRSRRGECLYSNLDLDEFHIRTKANGIEWKLQLLLLICHLSVKQDLVGLSMMQLQQLFLSLQILHQLKRGGSEVTTPEQRVQIGRYALENGNENARRHFLGQFELNESTIRNFKKAYKEKLGHQQKQHQPQPIAKIISKPRGCPPILLQLDEKLIKFLRAVRAKGGVVNIHVVRVTTKALIKSNPLMSQLHKFSMPRSRSSHCIDVWGTQKEQALLHGHLYHRECTTNAGENIDKKIKQYMIPPELVLNSGCTRNKISTNQRFNR